MIIMVLKMLYQKQHTWCLGDNRLKSSDLLSESCMIRLKILFVTNDPIQKQRFIRVVSEILDEMKGRSATLESRVLYLYSFYFLII